MYDYIRRLIYSKKHRIKQKAEVLLRQDERHRTTRHRNSHWLPEQKQQRLVAFGFRNTVYLHASPLGRQHRFCKWSIPCIWRTVFTTLTECCTLVRSSEAPGWSLLYSGKQTQRLGSIRSNVKRRPAHNMDSSKETCTPMKESASWQARQCSVVILPTA